MVLDGRADRRDEPCRRVQGLGVTVDADGLRRLTLRLHDDLIDLDQPVEVVVNGQHAFSGKVDRSVAAIFASLLERPDPKAAATATLDLSW